MGLSTLSFEDISEKLKKQFYSQVAADEEKGLVEQILYLPNEFASMGEAFPWIMKSQSLIHGCRLEANKVVFSLRAGEFEGSCVPGLRPLCWKKVSFERGFVKVVMEGIGGAANSFFPMIVSGADQVEMDKSVMIGKNLKRNEVLTITAYYKALNKIIVGIDDTDTSSKGDTYLTALEIGNYIKSEGYGHFIKEGMVINYPLNPFKTTNNASSCMVFLHEPHEKNNLTTKVIQKAGELSASKETGVAILEGIEIPPALVQYTELCKAKQLDVDYSEKIAKSTGVKLLNLFDGERGKIGALSSLGYVDKPAKGIAPSLKFRLLFRIGNTSVKIKDMLKI